MKSKLSRQQKQKIARKLADKLISLKDDPLAGTTYSTGNRDGIELAGRSLGVWSILKKMIKG